MSGTFGANLNTEIIQEQQVLTGGIPAEYVGAPGLLSSVITKSGTNRFSGSVNYFFQNDGLVAEGQERRGPELLPLRRRRHRRGTDRGEPGGGSLGSYRRLERADAVVALDGGRRDPHRRERPGSVLRPRHVGRRHGSTP